MNGEKHRTVTAKEKKKKDQNVKTALKIGKDDKTAGKQIKLTMFELSATVLIENWAGLCFPGKE